MKNIFWFTVVLILVSSCSGNKPHSDAYGNFETTEILVSSEAQGKLLFLRIEEGDHLKVGDTVGVIDTIQLYLKKQQLLSQGKSVASRVSNLIAQIEVLNQQKKNLLIDRERILKMLKDGAATQKQFDDADGAIEVIDRQVISIKTQNQSVFSDLDALDNQVRQVQDQIKKSIIINTVDGTLLEKYMEAGEVAVPGKIIYKIGDLSEMYLRAYVSGDQLPHVRLGQKVEVIVDHSKKSNKTMEGTVTWISGTGEFTPKIIQTKEERVKLVYAIKVKVKNDGTLKIAMPGEVNFNFK